MSWNLTKLVLSSNVPNIQVNNNNNNNNSNTSFISNSTELD